MKLERLIFIDICKGLGIIFVVLGHIFPSSFSQLLYIFHMPLFFFIGGYIFRPKSNIKTYFFDKSIHLLIPYAVYLILIYPLNLKGNPIGNTKELLTFLINPILGGQWLYSYTTVFWFVTCFFLTQQLFNYIITSVRKENLKYYIGFILVAAYLVSTYFIIKIPWNANVVLMALPIFYLGYVSRTTDYKPNILAVIGICIIAVSLLNAGYSNYFDMKKSDYGIPVITLLSSFSFIYMIIFTTKYISKNNTLTAFFCLLGEASMVIMYLHQPIQHLTNEYFTSDLYIRSLFALFLPVIFYILIKRYSLGRALFLGSKVDFLYIIKSQGQLNKFVKSEL